MRMGQKGKGYGLAIQDRASSESVLLDSSELAPSFLFMDWPP